MFFLGLFCEKSTHFLLKNDPLLFVNEIPKYNLAAYSYFPDIPLILIGTSKHVSKTKNPIFRNHNF